MAEKRGLKSTVAIISYAGNGIWGILFLFLFVGCLINGGKMMEETSLASFFGGAFMVFAFVSALVVLSCVVCIYGVRQMGKRHKRGFIFYLIGNLFWSVLLLFASEFTSFMYMGMAAVSIVFTVYYFFLSRTMK